MREGQGSRADSSSSQTLNTEGRLQCGHQGPLGQENGKLVSSSSYCRPRLWCVFVKGSFLTQSLVTVPCIYFSLPISLSLSPRP